MSGTLKQDLKKTFFRVKQKADQNFGRAEKSEVLPDELQQVEQQVGSIQKVCHTTYKKIKDSYPSIGVHDQEKRKKKIVEHGLANHFRESAESLEGSLYGDMYKLAGDLETELAQRTGEMEADLEKEVMEPIAQLTDVEIPNIIKLRKTLSKSVLDMDSAKNRFVTMQNDQAKGKVAAAKVDPLKQEFEDAQVRVEQAKDQLSLEMCTFRAKEGQHCQFLINFVEIHAKFYKAAYELFEKQLPRMREQCERERVHPMFGVPLEEHVSQTEKGISCVLEQCIGLLDQYGLEEEGLFRIAGSASKVKKIKSSFDARVPIDFEEIGDIHCISTVLKQYLRELPEPLMTFDLYEEWIRAAQYSHEDRMTTLWKLCQQLPKENSDNLRYLMKFLAKLVQYSETNKMTSSNVAIVMGPNLLWSKEENQSMMSTGAQSAVVEALVSHADYFFPGEIDFTIAREGGTPTGTLKGPPLSNNMLNSDPPSYQDVTSLSPSNMQNSAENVSTQGTSPRISRKITKKPPAPPPPIPERQAPPPPGEEAYKPVMNKTTSDSSVGKADRKPGGKHERSHSGTTTAAHDKPIERPSVPPPAPPKPANYPERGGSLKAAKSEQNVGGFKPPPSPAKPERPRLPSDRPGHRREASGGTVHKEGAKVEAAGEGDGQQHKRTGSDGQKPVVKPPRPPPARPLQRDGSNKNSTAAGGAIRPGNGDATRPVDAPSNLPPKPEPPSPQHKTSSLPREDNHAPSSDTKDTSSESQVKTVEPLQVNTQTVPSDTSSPFKEEVKDSANKVSSQETLTVDPELQDKTAPAGSVESSPPTSPPGSLTSL